MWELLAEERNKYTVSACTNYEKLIKAQSFCGQVETFSEVKCQEKSHDFELLKFPNNPFCCGKEGGGMDRLSVESIPFLLNLRPWVFG